ncbi:MAG: hypothetical protein HOO96_14735 [Polyangiaceae bacterium]|nr:hypothetical protein [Polyangiaceae bacterium]
MRPSAWLLGLGLFAVSAAAHAEAVTDLALAPTADGFQLVVSKSGQVFTQALALTAAPSGSPVVIASRRTVSPTAGGGAFVLAPGAKANLLSYREVLSDRTENRYLLLPARGSVVALSPKTLDPTASTSVTSRGAGGFFGLRAESSAYFADLVTEDGTVTPVRVGALSSGMVDETKGEAVAVSYTGGVLRTVRLLPSGAPATSLEDRTSAPGIVAPYFFGSDGDHHVFLGNRSGAGFAAVQLSRSGEVAGGVASGPSGATLLTAASDSDAVFTVSDTPAGLVAHRVGRDLSVLPAGGVPLGRASTRPVAAACSPAACAVALYDGQVVRTLAVGRDNAVSGPFEVTIVVDPPLDAGAKPPTSSETVVSDPLFSDTGCSCAEVGTASGRGSFAASAALAAVVAFVLRRRRRG